jgi:hypothetical protein
MKNQDNRKPLFSPHRLLETKPKAAEEQSFLATNKTASFYESIKVRDELEKPKRKPTKLGML